MSMVDSTKVLYVHFLTKWKFCYRVITRAFSHLWTKCGILIHCRDKKGLLNQFIKLEWMRKGIDVHSTLPGKF